MLRTSDRLRRVRKRGWRSYTGNEEHGGLFRSPSMVRAVKSRRLRWAGHIARIAGIYSSNSNMLIMGFTKIGLSVFTVFMCTLIRESADGQAHVAR